MTSQPSDRYAVGFAALSRLGGPDVAEPVLAASDIAPDIVRFAIEFAFGDVLSRPGLALTTQELCTVGALAALGHPASQLAWHMGAAVHVGCSQAQVEEARDIGEACARRSLGQRPRESTLTATVHDLVTVAALTAFGHDRERLAQHLRAALTAGATRQQIVQVVEQMAVYAGFPAALNGIALARQAFAQTPSDASRASAL